MKNDFTYKMPTKIIFSQNSINYIDKYINERKTLLITSSGFIKRGLVNKICELSNNIVSIISDVKSHPEFDDLEVLYRKAKEIDYELILAIGGGSVLDASKFLSVYNKDREFSFVDALVRGKIEKKDYKVTPIISVPTTAGTGSEITPWATIWDMNEKKKYSLHLENLFPEIALYDPCLTVSIPKDITIQTGLDTLSHALESIWNKNANSITIDYAIKASKLIIKYLPKLVKDLENIEYREKIMLACMYSGLAFSNTQTALAHAMSYYITAHKNIPHGIACSFTLPLLLDNIIGKYKFIDDALIEIFGELSSTKLVCLFKELEISINFIDYGIEENDKIELINSLQNNQRSGNSLVSIDE